MEVISYTSVAIDIFHYGQLRLLEQAKRVSDYHICGLYTDKLCLKWNGSLVMTYEERLAILNALKCVDDILKQKSLDPTENLKYIHEKYPNSKIVFFQGHQNWIGMPGTNFITSIGGEIIKPDYYSSITRSQIREKLNQTNGEKPFDIESYTLGDVTYFPIYNSTKANTLQSLKPQLEKSKIEQIFIFTTDQWNHSSKQILNEIKNKFDGKIVIRSSSKQEDGLFSSYAGYFHSEIGIKSGNTEDVSNGISKVIKSYSKNNAIVDNEQILVQSQTEDVLISGVVFTRNIQNNSPYYLINFDRSSSTDTVTSGKVDNKLEIIKNISSDYLPECWKTLIESVREIENSLDNLALDIEFAIKSNNEVVIFQVRPIAANQQSRNIYDDKLYSIVGDIINEYRNLSDNSVYKSQYTLSDMSFWNPAEIIGDRADNLSYSLYRYLIMNKTWNLSLIPLGYKEINRDLMVRIGNKPYIEVETAFAALLPNEINSSLTKKLIFFYQSKLKTKPELHDKIEFEIVHNCFSPLTDEQLNELNVTFDSEEIKELRLGLINLTQNIFDNYRDIINKDLSAIKKMSTKRESLLTKINETSIQDKINTVIKLIDDAKMYGTPQFSRMARLAFIGNQYLKGLVFNDVITQQEHDCFLFNIETVATKLSRDYELLMKDNLTIKDFNKVYGHLRPGTYNITKLPYIKDSRYLSNHYHAITNHSFKCFELDKDIFYNKINSYLSNFELNISTTSLLNFIEQSIKLRESFKFEFTKNLSYALEILAEIGSELSFDRQMLSYLSIENLVGIMPSSGINEIKNLWNSQIQGRRNIELRYKYITLPSLVFGELDYELVESYSVQPNYITNSIVKGEVRNFDSIKMDELSSSVGKIAVIEKADPGYDWIFSKGIAGLITRFGGVASHMAIRCAEFGIPAAIGCGQIIFNNIKDKKIIELDCKNKEIRVIE